ncbi:uncharacterized protein LTR77_001170 [Saxophila tyrrhenica]|uniref:Apple domain-containing protein n=1 Tax=Saxophila tyrrhenica TaxID=1690608 RepID=A0AAV9PK24_9PEZI|nr:hypothetical protein LTR77_001170 [Saxophila tyrrhenica]
MESTFKTSKSIKIKAGGYAECFSACSHSEKCAGFSYKGTERGTCHLKSQMPENMYVVEGSNFVSCAKTNSTAAAPGATEAASSSSSHTNRTIIIVGSVLGGIGFLVILLVLFAFFAKRHRKKIENRRATTTHVIQGPFESEQLNSAGYQRQESSANDVFAPFGGFYHSGSKSCSDLAEQADVTVANKWTGSTPPGMRAEGGFELLNVGYLPSPKQHVGNLAMPDPAAFRPRSTDSGSRSPRFHEHLDDYDTRLDPPSTVMMNASPANDSPTLGRLRTPVPASPLADHVRRQQFLAYQTPPVHNGAHYNAGSSFERDAVSNEAYSGRSTSPVSPVSNNDPVDPDFSVSPLFGSNGRQRW